MEVAATMSVSPAPPPPPPVPSTPSLQRRPRVREVSSRFMTPLISPGQRRPKHHQTQQQPDDSLPCSDENKPIENFETPFVSGCQIKSTVNNNNNSTLRRQRSVKLFKENGGANGRVDQQHHHPPPQPNPTKSSSWRNGNGFTTPSRPDTPVITVPSRYRLIHQKSASINSSSATKLLQSIGIASANHVSDEKQSKGNVGLSQNDALSVISDTSSLCSEDDDRNSAVHCSVRSLPDIRSSSDGDLLPTVSNSNRLHSDRMGNRANLNNGGGDSLKYPASPCSRSLNFSSSSGEHQMFQLLKGNEKLASSLSRSLVNSVKSGICLPPVPPCPKLGNDTKKGRKGSSHQEDMHTLRILYNRYLQWRFSNAKAESSLQAKQRESERALHSLALKISEMYDGVKRKRVELELLQRAKTLSAILESQIPFLEEWSVLEGDYAVSLSEAVQALLNASLRLPTTNNLKVDLREMEEALNSALNIMETIASSVHKFVPKAEEIHSFLADLARVVGDERALIEGCGDLLSETYKSQMEECSLRAHLMQLFCNNLQKIPIGTASNY